MSQHRAGVAGRWDRLWGRWACALGLIATSVALLGATGVAQAAPRRAAHPRVRAIHGSAAVRSALVPLFAKRRGLPLADVAGVRPGTLHAATVTATGRQWAIAAFRTTGQLSPTEQVRLQDGAGSAVFTRRRAAGHWRLVALGVAPLACDPVVPAAVRAAWHLAPAVRCGAAVGDARHAAHALALRPHAATTGGPSGAQIASIALGQVGESDLPVSTNFGMDCDPYTTLVGPVYAGPSYRGCEFDSHFNVENENEEWCADFAEWVWQQAGVTADMKLINPGAKSFYDWGQAQGQPLTVDGTDPQVGDAVVFYEPGPITTATPADHVGIVTGVNPDGTVDLVNGDFVGATNISVQYNANIDLKTWASQVWSPGEQWVFVAPPTGAQPPTPTAAVIGSHVAATGAPAVFTASASQPGESITSYAWSFGEGNGVPGATATGPTVRHVFTDPGIDTVTLIATSNLGTITVKTFNVDVVAPSTTVASTPSEAVYYNDGPVTERLFSVDGSGALTEESFDGASWLDEALPGSWSADAAVTSLDDKVDGTLTPHVFGRSASGTLQEATLGGTTWTVQPLAGAPAAGSPIAATDLVAAGSNGSQATYPAVFFADAAGQIVESSAPQGTWTTSTVGSAPGLQALAAGTITGRSGPVPALYALTGDGTLLAFTPDGSSWTRSVVPTPLGVASGSGLTAVDAGVSAPGAFFVDRAGHVAAVTSPLLGPEWQTQQISGTAVQPGAGLQAVDTVTSTSSVVPEVAAVTSAGTPLVLRDVTGSWQSRTLPGSATTLRGLGAYPVPGASQTLLFATANGLQADSQATPAASWTPQTLPSTPATFPDRVVLYAADGADLQAAQTAAQDAGLPASQVTGSFATAWADGVSGDYLVITVGGPASTALYFNPCGWTNPSGAVAGSTPFSYVTAPTDTLPGANLYLQANGATAADTASLAEDLAYYAVHGALPPGVTTVPAQVGPADACAGSPTAG